MPISPARLTIFSLAPLDAASHRGGNFRIAPTISAATDVRFAEPGVADAHTTERVDRDVPVGIKGEDARVVSDAMVTFAAIAVDQGER
eukprot:1152910-Pyramimonas_sp.AAC.1